MKELWSRLESKGKDDSNVYALKPPLSNLKMKEGDDLVPHLEQFLPIAREIQTLEPLRNPS